MTMYCNNILSSVKDISSLQWYLFSKYQFESEKLPPTQITLVQKCYGHIIFHLWGRCPTCHHQPFQTLIILEGKLMKKNNICYPVMTLSAPVLDSAVQLALCLCKGGCSSRRCRSAKKACFVQKCVNVLTVKIIKTKMTILLHMWK